VISFNISLSLSFFTVLTLCKIFCDIGNYAYEIFCTSEGQPKKEKSLQGKETTEREREREFFVKLTEWKWWHQTMLRDKSPLCNCGSECTFAGHDSKNVETHQNLYNAASLAASSTWECAIASVVKDCISRLVEHVNNEFGDKKSVESRRRK
jgi:hypothetical protein